VEVAVQFRRITGRTWLIALILPGVVVALLNRSPSVTAKEQFDRIRVGMNFEDLTAILGNPDWMIGNDGLMQLGWVSDEDYHIAVLFSFAEKEISIRIKDRPPRKRPPGVVDMHWTKNEPWHIEVARRKRNICARLRQYFKLWIGES
jgi:hypothetical protein